MHVTSLPISSLTLFNEKRSYNLELHKRLRTDYMKKSKVCLMKFVPLNRKYRSL